MTLLGVEADSLTLDFLTGTVNEQIAQFLASTGEPVNVPLWALGPWMSSNNWDSEAEVRKQVALTEEHGIPATVLVIEAWSDEATFYIFNDAHLCRKARAATPSPTATSPSPNGAAGPTPRAWSSTCTTTA